MADLSKITQQVSHWVHDEQSCVTVQRIVQSFNLPWDDALSVLKDVPVEDRNYSVTLYSPSKNDLEETTKENVGINMTVFEMAKESYTRDDKPDESLVWYALSLQESTESTHTAHERDRSDFKNNVAQFAVPASLRGATDSSEAFASTILVSEEIKHLYFASAATTTNHVMGTGAPVKSKVISNRPVVPKKKTVTTAKNFFANKKSSASSKAGSSSTKTTTLKEKKTAKPTQTSTLSFQSKKRDGNQSSKSANKARSSVASEEKENVQNKPSTVGNADDFVGDVENSDDEEMMDASNDNMKEKAEPAKVKQQTTKKVSRRAYQMDDDSDDDNAQSSNQPEAMDVDKPKKTTNANNPKHKRRRKKMVEKTFADDKGYLRTETQAIWEEIPSDEEDVPVALTKVKPAPEKKAKKSSVPPNKMKQGSLMGFFTKKK